MPTRPRSLLPHPQALWHTTHTHTHTSHASAPKLTTGSSKATSGANIQTHLFLIRYSDTHGPTCHHQKDMMFLTIKLDNLPSVDGDHIVLQWL